MTSTLVEPPSKEPSTGARHELLTLLALAFFTHVPIVLLDGVYWDGWILEGRVRANDFEGFADFYSQVGMPEFAPLHWALATIAFPLGHRVAGLAAAIIISLTARSIALTLVPTRRATAWWVGALMCSNPGLWTSMPEVSITTYFVYLAAFFLGAACLLRGYAERSIRLLITGHVLTTLSYAFPSLVPYSAVLGLALLAVFRQRDGRLRLNSWLAATTPPALAVLYFILHRIVAPPHGMFAGYNTPGLALGAGGFVTLFIRQLQYVLFSFYDAAFANALKSMAEITAAGLLAWGLFPKREASEHSDNRLLWLGFFLVAVGAAPYAAVNKGPNMAVGWETRHAVLAAIGLAVVALGVTERLDATNRARTRALLVVVGSCFVFSNYLALQSRHVRDLALSQALARAQLDPGVGLWVLDRFNLWSKEPFITTELAGLYRHGTERMDQVIIDASERDRVDFTYTKKLWRTIYSMRDARCPEAWAEISIEPGRVQYAEAEIAIRYWTYRFLWKGRMADFIDGMARVTIGQAQRSKELHQRCINAP